MEECQDRSVWHFVVSLSTPHGIRRDVSSITRVLSFKIYHELTVTKKSRVNKFDGVCKVPQSALGPCGNYAPSHFVLR